MTWIDFTYQKPEINKRVIFVYSNCNFEENTLLHVGSGFYDGDFFNLENIDGFHEKVLYWMYCPALPTEEKTPIHIVYQEFQKRLNNY